MEEILVKATKYTRSIYKTIQPNFVYSKLNTFGTIDWVFINTRGKEKRESRDLLYARMAAQDRISFHTLANSYDIQKRIEAAGHKPYFTHNSVAR